MKEPREERTIEPEEVHGTAGEELANEELEHAAGGLALRRVSPGTHTPATAPNITITVQPI